MQWTLWLEARTSDGGVTTAELTTFSRSVMDSTFADVGLALPETKALAAKLHASMLCDQMAEYAAHRRICVYCGVQPLKERRTRRLQTLFGTVEVATPRFKVCRCRQSAPMEKDRDQRQGGQDLRSDCQLDRDGQRRIEYCHDGGKGRVPSHALYRAACLHREQHRRADRLWSALPGWQAGLELTGREHSQSAGQRPNEQATADALVASRGPSRAAGQGRGPG
jgi:hypothetical protein